MKIDLNKINQSDIDRLLLEKEMNIAAADALFEFCFYSTKKFNHSHYLEAIKDYLELNLDNEEDNYFYETRIKPAIHKLKVKDYENDYYRQHIHPQQFISKNYQLTYLNIKPYQALPFDDIKIDENFKEISQIGYFTDSFSYLAVNKDDVTWMSTDPNEINTMKPSIDRAHGNVLACGLGLGYFPIMCAVKENVNSVTIVEKDSIIIEIFKKHILPLFEFKDKINIIQEDAFNFVRKDLSKYDYLFIDIWHNPEDGLPLYLKFQRILKNKTIEVDYWLEKSILAMLRRCLLTIVEESLLGYSDKNYKEAKNEYDQIINDLYFKTKDTTISSFAQLKQLLQDNELKKLI